MSQSLYIEPLDILFLRDNHLFGDSGDSSRAQMLPWPSVFAGAIRSRMIADAGASITALKNGDLPAPLDGILGTPEQPGDFTFGNVTIHHQTKGGDWDVYHPLPADLTITGSVEAPTLRVLKPQPLPDALTTSNGGPQLPLLRIDGQAKPVSGFWLNNAGWQAHLRGDKPTIQQIKHQRDLWKVESRLGIALDEQQRNARDGALYTSDAIAMQPNTGFGVTVHGADGQLPKSGLLRLGGDGRGASIGIANNTTDPEPDWDKIKQTGRFRLILVSPGIFPGGSQLPGCDDNGDWQFDNISARLVSQSAPRYEIVSGWDMASHAPKTAERCVPTGAVYWFEGFEGDINALGKLSKTGLWNHSPDNTHQASRRAEGFNRVAIANA